MYYGYDICPRCKDGFIERVETKKRREYFENRGGNCKKCGSKLNFVCKDCFKQLPDDGKEKYCLLHLAERECNEVTPKKIAAGVVSTVTVVAGVTGSAVKLIKKIKK